MGSKKLKLKSTARKGAIIFCGLFQVSSGIFLFGSLITLIAINSVTLHRVNRLLDGTVSPLKQHSKKFDIPQESTQISEHIYELKHESNVSALIILHYENEKKSSSITSRSKIQGYATSVSGACYSAYAKGAKWKANEKYLIDYSNNQGLTQSFIKNVFHQGTTAWNNAYTNGDIFGVLDEQHTAQGIDMNNPDGRNEVHFAYLSEPGVLAVTIVWGIFNGAENQREIFEWDQIYNEHFQWGDGLSNPSLNDLQNTVTHELGHASGLRDIYDSSCNHVTMYGYAAAGETKKRTLAQEDITGINALFSSTSGSSSHGSHNDYYRNQAQDNESNKLVIPLGFIVTTVLSLF